MSKAVPKSSPRSLADIRTKDDLTAESLQRILAVHLGNPEVQVKEVPELEGMDGTNDFYNSDVKTLSVMYKKDEDDEEDQEMHLVIKMPLVTGFLAFVQKLARPLLKEYLWYAKALPTLSKPYPIIRELSPVCLHAYSNYGDSFALTGCERACCVPCWLPFRDREQGVLVLENLTQVPAEDGGPYTLIDKREVPEYDTVAVVMTALGHFHGAWWKFLNDNGSVFHNAEISQAEILEALPMKAPPSLIKGMLQGGFKSMAKLLEHRGEDPKLIARLRLYGKNRAMGDLESMLSDSSKDKSTVKTVTHGDLWSNNMMFSKDESGKVKKVKFLDYQMMTFVHPARDICYFLYINTDKTFRDRYLDLCLRTYYSAYSSYFPSGFQMTYDQFEKEFQARRVIGLVWGILVMPNVLSPNQRQLSTFKDFRNVEKARHADIAGPDTDDDPHMITEIRRRIVEMAHEFDDLGIL